MTTQLKIKHIVHIHMTEVDPVILGLGQNSELLLF